MEDHCCFAHEPSERLMTFNIKRSGLKSILKLTFDLPLKRLVVTTKNPPFQNLKSTEIAESNFQTQTTLKSDGSLTPIDYKISSNRLYHL